MYKAIRAWDNIERALYETGNEYGIPEVPKASATMWLPPAWIGFNYARSCPPDERHEHGVHFFVDDYQFSRCWSDPDRYGALLVQFGAVMMPDFSVYTDYPKALQMWSVYRNCWLGRYWSEMGVRIIPTALWSTPDSYEYCFAAMPNGGIYAVSTVGNQATAESREYFKLGYEALLKRLQPEKIIYYGKIPDGIPVPENHIRITTFRDRLRVRCGDARRIADDGTEQKAAEAIAAAN